MIFILIQPEYSINAAHESLKLWSSSVFPSLFPFFVLSSVLKQTGILEQLIYKSPHKLNYNLIFTAVIGLICGYPSTSKLIGESDMDKPKAIYALTTCPSPVFLIGTVSTIFLQNTILAVYLLTATYLSLVTSFFIINRFNTVDRKTSYKKPSTTTSSVGHILTTAILDGMKSQAVILGIILMISIFTIFLESTHIFSFLAVILSPIIDLPVETVPSFLKGLLEMTSGVNALCQENITIYHKLSLCGFITSFGGMSIILESIAFIKNKIKATSIIAIKLLHGILTHLYMRLLLFIFPISQNVVFRFNSSAPSPTKIFTFYSIFAMIILLSLHQILLRDS